MPFPSCGVAGHDWSEIYTERLRGANNVLIIRQMQSCITPGCGKTREVFPEPRYDGSRVTSHKLD